MFCHLSEQYYGELLYTIGSNISDNSMINKNFYGIFPHLKDRYDIHNMGCIPMPILLSSNNLVLLLLLKV